VVAALNDINGLTVDESTMKIGGNFFKMDIDYEPAFDIPNSLRQTLQIEFSYTQPAYADDFQSRPISSLLGNYIGEDASFDVKCISPVETAADKLSALVWRVIKRDRTSDKDDPSIVRHLHDLYALRDNISNDFDQFKALVDRSHSIDAATSSRNTGMPIVEAAEAAYQMIISDAEYQREYSRFVSAMSYEKTHKRASMSDAAEYMALLISKLSAGERDDSAEKESLIDSPEVSKALSTDGLTSLKSTFESKGEQENPETNSSDPSETKNRLDKRSFLSY